MQSKFWVFKCYLSIDNYILKVQLQKEQAHL